MNSKCYLWIFDNLDKYEFKDIAIGIKESVRSLLITEESINSPEIITKMEGFYIQLTNSFYNNIIGYSNGLADKSITSAELDCYFISTSEGMVPIGYYRSIRPAESVSIVQRYLDECKENIKGERNRLIAEWQSKIDGISGKYDSIKDSKSPDILKAVFGSVIAAAAFLTVVSALGKMRVISFLLHSDDPQIIEKTAASLPVLSGADKTAITVFAICLLIALGAAAILGFFTVKEILLLKEKKTTDSVLKNILNYVTELEHGISSDINSCAEPLYIAARQGNTAAVVLNNNKSIIDNIKKNIEIAHKFVNKTEQERKGINNAVLTAGIIVSLLLPSLTYSGIIPALIESTSVQSRQASNTNNSNNSNVSKSVSAVNGNSNSNNTGKYEMSFDTGSDYIYPSDREYITKEQLDGLTREEIALLRNEIYARHGYEFQLQQYKDYFNKKSWYRPSSYFDESMLNSIEKANKDLIVEYEIEKGWR